MQTITTIGLDIAKSVFQVHGVDDAGQVVIRRQLKRRYVLAFFQKLSRGGCVRSHTWPIDPAILPTGKNVSEEFANGAGSALRAL